MIREWVRQRRKHATKQYSTSDQTNSLKFGRSFSASGISPFRVLSCKRRSTVKKRIKHENVNDEIQLWKNRWLDLPKLNICPTESGIGPLMSFPYNQRRSVQTTCVSGESSTNTNERMMNLQDVLTEIRQCSNVSWYLACNHVLVEPQFHCCNNGKEHDESEWTLANIWKVIYLSWRRHTKTCHCRHWGRDWARQPIPHERQLLCSTILHRRMWVSAKTTHSE